MKLLIVMLLLMLVIGLLTFLLGPALVSPAMPYLEWMDFVQVSVISMLAIASIVFAFYSLFYYDSVKLNVPADVFRLRKPWVLSMYSVFFVQLIVGTVEGIKLISEMTVPALIRIIIFAFLEGVAGILIFWIFSFFVSLPRRVKYIPFLSSRWR